MKTIKAFKNKVVLSNSEVIVCNVFDKIKSLPCKCCGGMMEPIYLFMNIEKLEGRVFYTCKKPNCEGDELRTTGIDYSSLDLEKSKNYLKVSDYPSISIFSDKHSKAIRTWIIEQLSIGESVTIDLDGGAGYGLGWLKSVFEGLLKQFPKAKIKIISKEEPYLLKDIVSFLKGNHENK